MAKKIHASDVPLGVHIHENGVEVVAFESRDGTPYFLGAQHIAIGEDETISIKERQISALKQAREEVAPNAKTCVVGLSSSQVIYQVFDVPPKERVRLIMTEAHTTADTLMPDTEIDDRVDAVNNLPGVTEKLLSVAKLEDVENLVEICAGAGLEVVGVDIPITAWQRTMYDEDRQHGALLDLQGKRPYVYIFGLPIGRTEVLAPNLSPEKIASRVREILQNARMEQFSDVRNLTIVGTLGETEKTSKDQKGSLYGADMPALIEGLAIDKGLDVSFITFGNNENPKWAFAAALAGWSFNINHVVRAQLLPEKKHGKIVFGIRITTGNVIRAAITAICVGVLIGGLQESINLQELARQQKIDTITQQLSSISEQTVEVGQLSADIHRLEIIDTDSVWLKSSGQLAALRLAYLGNAVPNGAWVENITHDEQGWTIKGGAESLQQLAKVATDFANISPGLQTSFSKINSANNNSFTIQITEPKTLPTPTPVPTTEAK